MYLLLDWVNREEKEQINHMWQLKMHLQLTEGQQKMDHSRIKTS